MLPLTLQEGGHVNYSQLPPLPFKRDADGNETAERDRGAFAALNGDHTHFLLIDDNGRSKVGWGAEVDLKAAVEQHGQSGRPGEATAGHHGLVRLHL